MAVAEHDLVVDDRRIRVRTVGDPDGLPVVYFHGTPGSRLDLAFGDELPVLMTEKDAVKCGFRSDPRLWYVPVDAEFAAEDARALLERVLAKIRTIAPAGGRL